MTPDLLTQVAVVAVLVTLVVTSAVEARERRFRRKAEQAFGERLDAFEELRELDLKRIDELDRRLREQELRP